MTKLSDLHDSFILKVDAGLDEEVATREKDPLMRVTSHVRDVRKSMDETPESFDLPPSDRGAAQEPRHQHGGAR